MPEQNDDKRNTNIDAATVSAVERQRFIRRLTSSLHYGPWIFFGIIALAVLSMTMTSTDTFPTTGIVFFIILSLIASALPFVIVVGVGYLIYRGYRQRKARTDEENAAEDDRNLGRAVASDDVQQAAFARPEIQQALSELEVVRLQVAEQIARRRKLFVPLGIIASILAIAAIYYGNSDPGFSLLLPAAIILFIGPIGAGMLADNPPAAREYVSNFKQNVIPKLLSQYGEFEYANSGPPPMIERLSEIGLLPTHEAQYSRSDDTIIGNHRGHELRIDDLELKARRPRRKRRNSLETVFRGIVVEIKADNPFSGTTIVLQKLASIDTDQPRRAGLSRIILEDPVFNENYVVYGDDEITARALLTPSTMERMLVLVDGQLFHTPSIFAEGDKLIVCFPYLSNAMNFFEPHGLTTNDARTQLAYQLGDLDNIFTLIDRLLETQTLRFRSAATRPAN